MTNAFYAIVVEELSEEDGGGFIARVPDLYGCQSDGETAEEALLNAQQAIGEWCDEMIRLGRSIPTPGHYKSSMLQNRDETVDLLRRAASVIEESNAEVARLKGAVADLQQRCDRLTEQAENHASWSALPPYQASLKLNDLPH